MCDWSCFGRTFFLGDAGLKMGLFDDVYKQNTAARVSLLVFSALPYYLHEMEYTVTHDEAANRFEIELEDAKALVEYKTFPGGIAFMHTEVPRAFEGRGIAGQLAKFVLEYAKAHKLKVKPYCPYIKAYIDRHPEYQSISMFHNPELGARIG